LHVGGRHVREGRDIERELARSARARAQVAQGPGQRANLGHLAGVHDNAAALQTEAATYYRELADRIALGLAGSAEFHLNP
jgi:hypothetical protein